MSDVITEYEARKTVFPFTLDDWISVKHRRGAEFTGNADANKGGRIKCRLSLYHNGNYVSAEAYSSVCGDAFVLAVMQIEKTIGKEWRYMRAQDGENHI